jgi:hypothetical protein
MRTGLLGPGPGPAKSQKKKSLRDTPQVKDGGLGRTLCHRIMLCRAVGGTRDGPGCEREEYDGQVDGGAHGNDRSFSVQGVVAQRKRDVKKKGIRDIQSKGRRGYGFE